ncbi:hypothetical protein NCER_100061 [Vairimorpha ceranae BRL01]|uniref:Uncharacterized protein n=2 Tax=Vairimorpha ceranae TaxID=40302 RepID=C4V6M5_VAIC1|nr:hypothetical protein AAJ76_1600047504 [Vairimorpha ceranae]EEQ83130.1 hypothetical protein NCER_100061 [Vairimorpha ceranae BRL01]KAF5141128.1 hypothetical protein G9O61_00g004440 [Vairimorpha ceranae]KKO75617.1 hypothetical protein AAJ76_1600047504 [Vairimorpha ceranae]
MSRFLRSLCQYCRVYNVANDQQEIYVVSLDYKKDTTHQKLNCKEEHFLYENFRTDRRKMKNSSDKKLTNASFDSTNSHFKTGERGTNFCCVPKYQEPCDSIKRNECSDAPEYQLPYQSFEDPEYEEIWDKGKGDNSKKDEDCKSFEDPEYEEIWEKGKGDNSKKDVDRQSSESHEYEEIWEKGKDDNGKKDEDCQSFEDPEYEDIWEEEKDNNTKEESDQHISTSTPERAKSQIFDDNLSLVPISKNSTGKGCQKDDDQSEKKKNFRKSVVIIIYTVQETDKNSEN